MATLIDKVYSLNIGVQGENIARAIELDMTEWVAAYPDASFYVLFRPYNESEAVPMLSTFEDNILTWTPTLSATAVSGVGYTEIRALDPETGLIRKSRIIPTSVENSVTGADENPPQPYADWVNRILEAGSDAVKGAAAVAAVSQGEEVAFEIDDDGHLNIVYTESGEPQTLDLGPVDAYAVAVAEGYTGTREEWGQAVADAEANGLKAEGYAIGKQNGVAVESGEYYQNNAKYYNEQAQSAKEDAEAAKTAAEAAQTAAETAQASAAASAADALEHTQSVIETWLENNIDPDSGYTLDRTLALPSAAAPADMVGDLKSAIEDSVYQELNQTLTKPSSGNAIETIEFRVIKNQRYLLTVTTMGTVTITTRETNLGETVERLYAGPAVIDLVITPEYDANFFRIVTASNATVSFKTLTTKEAYDIAKENKTDITEITDIIPLYAKNNSGLINGTAVVSDFDNVSENISYRLNFAVGSSSIPAHTPYGTTWKSTTVAYFKSIVKTPGTHNAGDTQIFIASTGIYTRYYAGAWLDWVCIANSEANGIVYVVDADGNGDYTSFCEAVSVAVANANSVVLVRPGNYDIISEMVALKGADYFTAFTSSTEQLNASNGLHIIGDPGAVLSCHYTGDNEYVHSYFAPINLKQTDSIIEGLTIDASNVRYCIHDDQWTFTEHYKHILKNCRLIIDNSNNTDWDRRLAFGGGLGVNGYIQFDNCYFKTVGLDGTAYSGYGAMGYHNSPSGDAQSTIIVNNCYFADNSTFRLTRHGTSTKMTRAFVSGCSFGREMELTYEQSSSTPHNCEIIDCNNVIRS